MYGHPPSVMVFREHLYTPMLRATPGGEELVWQRMVPIPEGVRHPLQDPPQERWLQAVLVHQDILRGWGNLTLL